MAKKWVILLLRQNCPSLNRERGSSEGVIKFYFILLFFLSFFFPISPIFNIETIVYAVDGEWTRRMEEMIGKRSYESLRTKGRGSFHASH